MAKTRSVTVGIKIITDKMTDEELNGSEITPAHDQIFCGGYYPQRMNQIELETLETLGWFEDEDSWSILA